MTHALLRDEDEQIDEVLVCFFPGPRSYTGENLVEVYTHGSPIIVDRVLKVLIAQGARPAEPGEFTFRGFRSGRMDLSKAEAVNDLIRAETDVARRLALRSLRGGLDGEVQRIRADLDEILIHIETELEFESDDAGSDSRGIVRGLLGGCVEGCRRLVTASERQQAHPRGLIVAICGKPNVGKSSLLNRILERNRALVSHIPGTTRDTIEERVEIGGIPFLCIDTAGVRQARDEIETLGIERTNSAIGEADAVLFLVDLSEGLSELDVEIFTQVRNRVSGKVLFPLANKKDLVREEDVGPRLDEFLAVLDSPPFRPISARTGEGVREMLEDLRSWASQSELMTGGIEVYVNARQGKLLSEAAALLQSAQEGWTEGLTLDRVADDLHHARHLLARLVGEEVTGDLLDEIFSRFCIGK
jgi:tRNA modification GTPase